MSNNSLVRYQDQILAGKYRLGAVIQRSAAGAVYETEFGDNARPAAIKIRFPENPGSARLVEQWQKAIELTHPHLLQVYEAGFTELDDAPVAYVVMERADVSLACVLMDRTLSEAETREILAPALSALQYLHKNGYAHSGLKPGNILAVGDSVKLSGDNPVLFENGADAADDMQALGKVIAQCLTPKPSGIEGVTGLTGASETLQDIVRHCLDPDRKKRWTANQVEERLEGRISAAPPPAPVLQFPAAVAERISGREEIVEEVPVASRTLPRWIFAALAALVLIVVLAGLWRKNNLDTAAVAPAPAGDRSVSAPTPSWPAPVLNDPPASGSKANRTSSVNKGRRGEGWSVVVATYGSSDAADKRQRELARRWPRFTFTVFQQASEKAQYLIVIGQNLSEDEAGALRKRAVSSGIPADTYIKKFQ